MKKRLTFSILGDSISTFEGYNPEGYNVFYDSEQKMASGIIIKDETWWGRVINFFDGELLVNNAWSGSRVTRYPDSDSLFPSGCSNERMNGLCKENQYPDIIIVYLGTNDWGYGVPLKKDRKDKDWSLCFYEAYSYMISLLKEIYSESDIYCCTFSKTCATSHENFNFPHSLGGIHMEEYNSIIREIVKKENCIIIDIYKHNKPYNTIDGTHPDASGMKTISNVIIKEIIRNGKWRLKYRLKGLFKF